MELEQHRQAMLQIHLSDNNFIAYQCNFNPTMENLIVYQVKYGMKLRIHSQTSTVQPLQFEEG